MLTIGMPVYNGERFLPKALDSLLGQTFSDFQILLSDNASTDGTQEIGNEYAARDRRIVYSRNERNMGAGWNYLHVYQLATGKYYKQAAHDDFCEPTFLETCIRVLEQDEETVVAHTKTRIVDPDGTLIENYECPLRADDADPVVRFSDLVLINHRCFPIFGVHRRSALDRLPPMGSFPHADGVLLAQLGLIGRFYESPERLFINTKHAGQSSYTVSSRSISRKFRLTGKVGRLPSMEWWSPNRKREITFPECHILDEYRRSIARSSLTPTQKARAYGVLIHWAARYHRKLLGDVVLAADQVIWNWQSSRSVPVSKSSENQLVTHSKGANSL
jgi:glycosyltransferase involved in cell wall biosynthesis